jgi:hypothetical protein
MTWTTCRASRHRPRSSRTSPRRSPSSRRSRLPRRRVGRDDLCLRRPYAAPSSTNGCRMSRRDTCHRGVDQPVDHFQILGLGRTSDGGYSRTRIAPRSRHLPSREALAPGAGEDGVVPRTPVRAVCAKVHADQCWHGVPARSAARARVASVPPRRTWARPWPVPKVMPINVGTRLRSGTGSCQGLRARRADDLWHEAFGCTKRRVIRRRQPATGLTCANVPCPRSSAVSACGRRRRPQTRWQAQRCGGGRVEGLCQSMFGTGYVAQRRHSRVSPAQARR